MTRIGESKEFVEKNSIMIYDNRKLIFKQTTKIRDFFNFIKNPNVVVNNTQSLIGVWFLY